MSCKQTRERIYRGYNLREINFSKNHNDKLHNKVFTTLRLGEHKHTRYLLNKFKTHRINLNTMFIKEATLIEVEIKQLQDISTALLCTDTGTDSREKAIRCLKVYYEDEVKPTAWFNILTFVEK